jgi:hypothetical protein
MDALEVPEKTDPRLTLNNASDHIPASFFRTRLESKKGVRAVPRLVHLNCRRIRAISGNMLCIKDMICAV